PGRGGPRGRGVAPRGARSQPRRASSAARRQRQLLGDTLVGAHDPPPRGRTRVSDIRITDLAHPELTDEQRAAIARAAAVPVTLTEEAVLEAAPRQTRLDDFGSDDFRLRLRVWLATVNEDERMNAVGRLGLYANCVRFLANRLKLTALLARHPEIRDVPIRRPIIVAGLPRSGTTHLLNLITTAARTRTLPC